ncbi:unnamed protein product (macronuclear) [Paramecium tetraurelia]|uniref:Histidine phosphatase family protein n=1 Tax=Paramecium tetraurelia TaxID=5888 RepID=A0D7F1_PARTE|nr:uncharacterized protein GSPATT00002010001 [Paramecium tetraurelia]CAK78968.1 unnamed protein product [Paramecium tetraurelia]|eukprot:XP_001446365.1 hypothetical protein (macronuclear) [Paramecium tetraurelia strain d4-2]
MIQIGQKTIQIWLVRHGQTEGNKLQILQGQDDGQLSALGIKQAEALGKRIKKEIFDVVYVSDLARTKQTFELIQKHHSKQMMPNFEPLLREKHAGQSLTLPKKLAAEQGVDIRVFKPDQGESWVDVNNRAQQMLQLIIQRCSDLKQNNITVLLVTHGGFIMEFMNQINYMINKKQPVYNNSALNCSITIVKYILPKGEVKIVTQNDASHIQKL